MWFLGQIWPLHMGSKKLLVDKAKFFSQFSTPPLIFLLILTHTSRYVMPTGCPRPYTCRPCSFACDRAKRGKCFVKIKHFFKNFEKKKIIIKSPPIFFPATVTFFLHNNYTYQDNSRLDIGTETSSSIVSSSIVSSKPKA